MLPIDLEMYLIVIVGYGYLTPALTWTDRRADAARWSNPDAHAVLDRYPQATIFPA